MAEVRGMREKTHVAVRRARINYFNYTDERPVDFERVVTAAYEPLVEACQTRDRRIAELEVELAKVTRERDEMRSFFRIQAALHAPMDKDAD